MSQDPMLDVIRRYPLPWTVGHLWPDRLPVVVDATVTVVLGFDAAKLDDGRDGAREDGYPEEESAMRIFVEAVNDRYGKRDGAT